MAYAIESVSESFGPPGSLGGQLSSSPQGVAVNGTGSGGVSAGTIYVVDSLQNRIERFDPSHDFVSAWGFDVIKAGEPNDLGESVFEVCTVAAECKAGTNSVSPAPGGELSGPQGVAIDQSTGNVYVTNSGFLRVEEFSATGSFIRAFGRDVIQSGHAGDTGTDFEVCSVAADCKSGESGSGAGAFLNLESSYLGIAPATAPNADDVLVADRGNRRISEYTSAGTFVRSFGWNVVESGSDDTVGGEFEVCNAGVDVCQIGTAGSGVGQFGNNAPTRVIEDSTGVIYTIDPRSPNFRVEKFTLPGNVVTPSGVFAEPVLSATTEGTSATNIAIDGSGNVLITKGFPAGATSYCLNSNSPSVTNDRRLLKFSSAGTLLATSLPCIGNQLPRGLAIDSSDGTIYFTSSSGPARVYVLGDVTPPTSTIDPVAEFDAFSATLEGKVDPEGPPSTECRFDYITKAAFEANLGEGKNGFIGAAKSPCLSNPGSGTTPIVVKATATSLAPSTVYEVRLVALKEPFGDVATASSPEEFTTAPEPPPTLVTGAVAPRGTTTARLNGFVNPNGSATEVHFEYGTAGPCSTNPCESTASQDAGTAYIPPGEPFTSIVADLEGLSPDTTYYYRLVGANGNGPAAGAERTFATRTTAELTLPPNALGEPEKRGIELVNNPDKGNQHVNFSRFGSGNGSLVTPDGNKMVWTIPSGAPGSNSGVYSAFLATRNETGWHSLGLLPPGEEQVGGGNLKYRAEFASPDFTHFIFRTEVGFFPGNTAPSTYVRLDDSQHQEVLAHFNANALSTSVDVTADTVHVLHTAEDTNILEDIGSGTPEAVGLMPGGSPPPCGIHFGTEFAGGPYAYPGYQWIGSTDASRVYFQTRGSECGGPEGLYVRNRETSTTTQIAQSATFIRATSDGQSAFFATTEALASDDENADLDVYRWNEGGTVECLTCVVPDANVSPVENGIRVSDDFSHVYFLSTSQLVRGFGKQGEVNIYVVSDGHLRFVAADPSVDPILGGHLLESRSQMEMSSDGNVLVFLSGGYLTADSVASSCVNSAQEEAHPCKELYRYDDRDGSLECVSCLHGGMTAGEVFEESNNQGAAFRISRDGNTIAFTTAKALIPADVNGGYDVYEWRNGAVRLITDGETKFSPGLASPDLADVDANGKNVFFAVADPGLTGYEADNVDNVYDARIGGGFPRPTSPLHCSEESCQGPLQAAPVLEQPASSSFSGRGNLAAVKPRCRRGRVRRHGHCVKRHTHRQRRHQRRTVHVARGRRTK
jgi:hypothetical protein